MIVCPSNRPGRKTDAYTIPPEVARRGAPARGAETACQLYCRDVSRHLEKGKRNATRLCDDPVSHPLVDPPQDHGVQQLSGVDIGEAADHEFGKAGQHLTTSGACREDQGDRIGQ
jgi:hypothetical protein